MFTSRIALSSSPLTLIRVTMWAFLALLVTGTAADPDLWGHLRFGLDMLETGTIHTADPYSFTADRPWVNHEWLAELLMAIGYRLAGPAGLVLLKLAVIAVVAAVAFRVAREEHADPLARDIFVALVLFSTYSRTQVVRPQMFSVALACLLLYLLRRVDRGHERALIGVPLCFAAWVNLHGAWIVGLGMLGMWMAGDAWQRRTWRHTGTLVIVGIATLAATLLNPYGIGLWRFLAETVRPSRPDITDWAPLLQLPPGILLFESFLPIVAAFALWKKRAEMRVSPRDAAVVLLLGAATIRVGRVDAFLQSAIAVLFAPQIVAWLRGLRPRVRPIFTHEAMPVGVMTVALAVYAIVMAAGQVRGVKVVGHWLPDRDAAMYLRDERPGARVLTWFDWGEYALWQLSPSGIRISMDGRRETTYSAKTIDDHFRFYRGGPDMVDYPERIGADHVWLPSHMPMIEPLTRRGWVTILDTGKSVVLARNGQPAAGPPQRAQADVPPFFPWP